MVYIKEWTKFESAAVELYTQSPRKTRYCVKFAQRTGQLVLKLTDDRTCLKYKSHSAIILNRFEQLSLRLLSLQANAKRRSAVAPAGVTAAGAGAGAAVGSAGGTPAGDRDDPMEGKDAGPAAVQAATGAAGKKKKKKGKK
ncbi:hypothetical protein Q5752_003870 [Cryptotrichosporon argae]